MTVQTGYSTSIDDGEAVSDPTSAETVVVKEGLGEVGVQAIGATNVTSIFWAIDNRFRAKGTTSANFTFPSNVVVNTASQVAVSICERDPNGIPALGSAQMSILNVVPRNGSVDVRFNVGWSELLPVRFNFIIVN